MEFSLALLRHRLAARRSGAQGDDTAVPRPDGPLLRVHLSSSSDTEGTTRLLRDLVAERSDLVVVTSGEASDLADIALVVDCPPETGAAARSHLDFWSPDAMLFSGPDPHPVLWTEARSRSIPLIAVEADPARHPLALVRPLAGFDFVHARAPDPRLPFPISSMSPLARTPPPPATIDSDLEDMSSLLVGRPIWLATMVPKAELDMILSAHIEAAKLSHRLLLILEPADPSLAPDLRAMLNRIDYRAILRSSGEDPAPDTQVLIADDPGEIGLWARVASVCYLGGTMTVGPICDPMIPASLGSVIVHGPERGEFAPILNTLDNTRGAQFVAEPHRLGQAVEELLSPERAAEIAHEAWDIATRGAEATNLALRALSRALDRAGRR